MAVVTALIGQAYDSHGALGVSVDGKLWEAPQVAEPFSGQQFQISLLSRNEAIQLYRLLVPSS
jgi:preprotein translocase subunit SecD